MSSLGNKIKFLREQKDINQSEFAKILGIANSTLSQYETGQRIPSDEIKLKIANYFKVTIDYLLGNSSESTTIESENQDISLIMTNLKEKLKNYEGVMFDGEILDETTAKLLLEALEHQEKIIKEINKKYIPKKYKK